MIVTPGAGPNAAPSVAIEVPTPSFAAGTGPRVAIDAGHNNYRIRSNYAVFAEALTGDGFTVEFVDAPFNATVLASVDLLVIVNPLNAKNVGDWSLPTPSAFTPDEIAAVGDWVEAGGGLWVVADHMPFPGAAEALAARVGFALNNGFGFREREPGQIEQSIIGFSRADGTILAGHPITDGARIEERLEQLQSFTGATFETPDDATALVVMPADAVTLMPEVAWEFSEHTQRRAAGGWALAAVRELGRGRVAMFGEAAMLSARYVDHEGEWFGVGVQHPDARDNLQLVLNTARWIVDGPGSRAAG
ncbi:hypothetical protein DB30_00638 [Enhygromyxa salina]|uniref:DUF4350 domain-containing protein n=1 Tax=Enhygromyxa salina TaxID=215803 RepID=A0A0C2A4P1_9BACT|nr:hypothetical protein DB30_00638 [Enhygromyxa salina]